jgi:hypothetical protein
MASVITVKMVDTSRYKKASRTLSYTLAHWILWKHLIILNETSYRVRGNGKRYRSMIVISTFSNTLSPIRAKLPTVHRYMLMITLSKDQSISRILLSSCFGDQTNSRWHICVCFGSIVESKLIGADSNRGGTNVYHFKKVLAGCGFMNARFDRDIACTCYSNRSQLK